ncbi:MAG: DUF1642 domain-containing protein [Lactobacillus sp.]|jgi:hypothetical protein|nr:DUF1642 domain-containing protein [Lactobacillus sp.]MCI1941493.1 DUF1642 domain-containing protein [Lactobacillus sp.]MCI1971996.1 DUF1642 domain-containing protein [Lactobacillus sp.]MCI2016161.1 DUF1642 domain-containing protein [Lactobacillus sp.]MCI2036406.1 DUF1642 domain-containing protein [Lactobacillus sp.]
MSLYAVKNDKGDYLNGVAGEKPIFGGLDKDCVLNGEDAGWLAGRGYGHVVELIEAPAKAVVSEEAVAKILREAKRYADDYISEDKLELEIKMALSAYKPAGVSEKDVVSQEEAKMLEKAKNTTVWRPASVIDKYAYEHERQADDEVLLEDRLMRAYVNGWTVEKPKRYVLPMPYGADDDDPDNSPYAAVNRDYHAGPAWYQGPCVSFKKAREHYSVTQADIDAAPAWVRAITPVEVKD